MQEDDTDVYTWFNYRIKLRDALPGDSFSKGLLPIIGLVCVCVMIFVDPYPGSLNGRNPNMSFVFWFGIVVFYFVLYFPFIVLWKRLLNALGIAHIFLPIPSIFAVIVLMLFGEVLIAVISGRPGDIEAPNWPLFPFYYAAEQSFQILYIAMNSYLLRPLATTPGARRRFGLGKPAPRPKTDQGGGSDPDDARTTDAASAPSQSDGALQAAESVAAPQVKPQGDLVHLAGRTIHLSHIWYARSREHYVELQLPKTSLLLRARISDFVKQVPQGCGIQIHRSTWIAADAIAKVERNQATTTVVMRDETRLKVARGRRKAFDEWVARKPEHTDLSVPDAPGSMARHSHAAKADPNP